ncbi:MAG: DHA1 family bicyclomycin/chloramphenicol resistance-like MFS transporter [Saprospiraceae bacterium]|jgi:DHA1 family bicyclomycin/chloramphenicol resistance-like MFS transporter
MIKAKKDKISELEFIALMAFLMSIVALSIDGILPGLSDIGVALNRTNNNDLQGIITMIFLGLGIGQLFFGTLSDSLGRKPVVYAGVITFCAASFIAVNATSLEMMLVARLLQGIGLSAPRSVSISIIRDLYKGDNMARIMSFITVIFILVPMIAPFLGQLILNAYNWKAIFYFQMIVTIITVIWFALRQRETVTDENRLKLSKFLFIDGVKEFFKFRETVVYTIVSGFMTGSFMVYLSVSKQIFQDQYGLVSEFVYIFGGISFFLGFATFINGSIVMRFGMKKIATISMYIFTFSAFFYTVLFFSSGNPGIYVLIGFIAIQFLCIGFIFGNVRALAMEPIGHIAGVGASLNGFISTMMAVPLAVFIGHFIDNTALPLFIGFMFCGLLSILCIYLLDNFKIDNT